MKKTKVTRQQLIQLLLSQRDSRDDIQELVDLLVEKQVSININKVADKRETLGDRAADKLAEVAGSWTFIFLFGVFMILWISTNLFFMNKAVDPYPFILLNLMLSCLAAVQAPIIMMSQNRQDEKDRIRSENNYKVDVKSELLLEDLHNKMDKILYSQKVIKEKLNIIENSIEESDEDDFVELS